MENPIEVTLSVWKDNGNTYYKVTKRVPDLAVADTRMFKSKEEALRLFDEWSQ